ncbi:MAG TPA: hypothetical protein VEC14_04565 [Reyranellaceae bacterium]|nr:hypothetical protein [Reyranellaceae bacterium]
MKRVLALLLLFVAADAAAQASPEAQRAQDQAATVLANARRCPQTIDKAAVDRFAGRASAVIRRADGQPVARGQSGDYDQINANLVMAAQCKMTACPGKGPAMLPPNCVEFAKIFNGLHINQANWQLNEGLR